MAEETAQQFQIHLGDTLPDFGDLYLVCIQNDLYRHKGWRIREFFAGHWMLEEEDGEKAEDVKILYWAELPPIPAPLPQGKENI